MQGRGCRGSPQTQGSGDDSSGHSGDVPSFRRSSARGPACPASSSAGAPPRKPSAFWFSLDRPAGAGQSLCWRQPEWQWEHPGPAPRRGASPGRQTIRGPRLIRRLTQPPRRDLSPLRAEFLHPFVIPRVNTRLRRNERIRVIGSTEQPIRSSLR